MTHARDEARLALTQCTVDLRTGEVDWADRPDRTLRAMELALLRYAAAHPVRPLTQLELLREVWGYRGGVVTRTLGTTMQRLRSKVEVNPRVPAHLLLVRGVGYRFEPVTGGAEPWKETLGVAAADLDSFVGRAAEVDQLLAMRAAGARLICLKGSPGSGTSRLAREVWRKEGLFISVDPESSGLADAVGQVLGASAPAGQLVAAVGVALAARDGRVVVLDGLGRQPEQAAATLAAWLAAHPKLQVVVTGRRRCGLTEERVVELGPLPIPAAGLPLEEALSVGAAALFVGRARDVRAGFRVRSLPDLRAVLLALDGLPLAVELGAARMRTLELAQLRARLEKRGTGALGKRSPLNTAVLEAWTQLDGPLREALGQGAVFRRSFSLEGAEAVLALSEGGDVLDAMEALVHCSLVRVQEEVDGPRFRLFGAVRDFVGAHAPLDDAVRDRHAHYYAGLGSDEMQARRGGAEHLSVMARLERALPDLWAAAEHATRRGLAQVACGAARAASWVSQRGGARERSARVWTDALTLALPPRWRVVGAIQLGMAYRGGNRAAEALATLRDAVPLAEQLGDPELLGAMLQGIADVLAYRKGQPYAEVVAAYERAIAEHERVGHQGHLCHSYLHLSTVHVAAGQRAPAQAAAGHAAAAARRSGHPVALRNVLLAEATLALGEADRRKALGLLTEARTVLALGSHKRGDVHVQVHQGVIVYETGGKAAPALALLAGAEQSALELGDGMLAAYVQAVACVVSSDDGQGEAGVAGANRALDTLTKQPRLAAMAWEALALGYTAQGRHGRAVEAAQRAQRGLWPGGGAHAQSAWILGECLLAADRVEDALEAFAGVPEVHVSDWRRAESGRVACLTAMDRAAEALARAQALEPVLRAAGVPRRLGVLLARLGRAATRCGQPRDRALAEARDIADQVDAGGLSSLRLALDA
jgi:tetratricopeptide (TPR) repeat protein